MIASRSPSAARAWCYHFQFEGKAPALAGTVFIRTDAPHHEIEAACQEHWRSIFPFDPPPITKLVPGMIVFKEKSE